MSGRDVEAHGLIAQFQRVAVLDDHVHLRNLHLEFVADVGLSPFPIPCGQANRRTEVCLVVGMACHVVEVSMVSEDVFDVGRIESQFPDVLDPVFDIRGVERIDENEALIRDQ